MRAKWIMDNSSLPTFLTPFKHQVAGHLTKDGCYPLGLLKHEDGSVLKPANKSPQGEVEISFYEDLQTNTELLPLREFTAGYFGPVFLRYNNTDIRFIKLEDITQGLIKPCIMDIKIGKQTWDPNATEEKRKTEDGKYADMKRDCGFCIPGYQVHDVVTGRFTKYGKDEGKKLTRHTAPIAFRNFLNYSFEYSQFIIKYFLKKLNEILDWWNSQRLIHVYSSSILLLYDAERLKEMQIQGVPMKSEEDIFGAKVHLIDFAHVVPANNRRDENYIFGIENLIEMLRFHLK